MEFIPTKRGGQKVIRDQYVYGYNSIKKSQPIGKYWKCEYVGCSARLITTGANNEFHSASGVHTHPPNPLSIVERNVRNEIKRTFGSNSLLAAKRTYAAIMQEHISRVTEAAADQKEEKSDGIETKNETESNEAKNETESNDTRLETNSQQPLTTNFVFPKTQLVKKKTPQKDFATNPTLNDAYNILKSVGATQKDDCATYGEHVGNKLRKLDDSTRAITQHKINNILFEAEMGMYTNIHPHQSTSEQT